jgi:hypothetical protein
MKRLLLLLPFLMPPATPPKAAAPTPVAMSITRDEAAMLKGYQGRMESIQFKARQTIDEAVKAIQFKAQHDLDDVGKEQTEYLTKIAARLGIPPEKLLAEYTISLDTGRVEPKAKGPAK